MATWQFDLGVLVKGKVTRGEVVSYFTGKLPPAPPWDEDMDVWGDYKSNVIQAFYEEGLLEDMEIRIDVSNVDDVFVGKALSFVSAFKCGLLVGDDEIENSTSEVKRFMMKSRAYAFCNDPNEYLDEVAKNPIEE